jgi:type I restriction enzyme S subunit
MNPQVRGLAPKGSVNSEYLFWSLRVLGVELQRIASVSVVPFVNTSTLMSQRIAVPPLAEQTAIARVLRWHDVVVRRLIRAKRRMIELLDEQKQAIIQHAVTRGLDPNVPLMPSGVLWIGDIPAHWRVAEVKRLGKLRAGSGFPHAFQGRTTGELPFFKVADMTTVGNSTRLCVASNAISLEDARTLGATIFPAQAIVFPKVGGALLTNKRRILAGPSCIDNNIMGFIPSGGDPEYWFLTLQLVDFGKLANPGPVPSLNESQVAEVRLPVPPDAEQSTIVDGVRAESRVVDEALIVAQREIDLIREYRTRLVCDVVTGKLDVRHVEVPYVPEDDVLDVPEADDELLPDDADLGEEADA